MGRILIATDAWHPQVNGVVRTLESTINTLQQLGHQVKVLSPEGFPSLSVPFYPEIPLSLALPGQMDRQIRKWNPDTIHISTEGPIGLLTRRFCMLHAWKFSTSYHTKFPEYLHTMARVPVAWTYCTLRWFHNASGSVMVATPSLERELKARNFRAPIHRWSRGVNLEIFYPRPKTVTPYPRPLLLYVGRVSREKGIEQFLKLDTPGTKMIVGDGPVRSELERQFPRAVFLGYRTGQALAECYANADLFVFPSRTDTFGLVMIEALASGLPVAAYPVTGPIDIVTQDALGCLDEDLATAVMRALQTGQPQACVEEGRRYTWLNCTRQFLNNLVPAHPDGSSRWLPAA